jgi:tetratricopeptide (TPR) repeat protein
LLVGIGLLLLSRLCVSKRTGRQIAACLIIVGAAMLSTACAKNGERAKYARLKSGDTYFAVKKYREAIVEYRGAIQRDPKFGEARYKLAEAYVHVHDAAGAYREYIRAADLMPENAESQLKAGQMLLLARQFEDAKARADRILAIDPKHVAGQILRGSALAGLKDLDSAISQIEDAIQLDPERSGTYDSLGTLELANGDRNGAEEAFKKAVQLSPASVPARLTLATFYLSARRAADAEDAFKETLRLDPKNPAANRALSLFYVATHRFQEAERYLKTVADAPGATTARLELADYYLMTARPTEAEQVLNMVGADNAKAHAGAQSRLAAVEYAEGKKPQAYARLNDLLTRQPKYAPALLIKARFLRTEHRIDEAVAQAKAATQADPTFLQGHFFLGKLYMEMSEFTAAADAFREILKLNPRATAAQIALSRAQLASGNTDASLESARDALNAQPQNPDAHLLLARGLIARGKLADAEKEMTALATKYPSESAVQSQMGSLFAARGDARSARRSFERALALDPNSVEALSGLVLLDLTANRPAEARARVETRLAQNADDSRLLLLAAETYAGTGDAAGAEQALRRAMAIDPADLHINAMRAQLFMSENKLEDAKAEFDTLAKRTSNSDDAVASETLIGVILEAQNRAADAQAQYERVLARSPQSAIAANNLAWLYAHRGGNLDVALGLAQTAAQQMPDRPEINDTLGWIYYKKDLPGQAIAVLERSVELDSTSPLYHYHLGLAYAKSGDRQLAAQWLERALTLNSEFDGASDARRLLASIRRGDPGPTR